MIKKQVSCLFALLVLDIAFLSVRLQAQGAWAQKQNFGSNGRVYSSYFAVDGKGYVGFGNNTMVNDLWQYDPASNSWTQEASIPGESGRAEMQGFTIGHYGYVGLGLSASGTDYNGFWKFDPSQNYWTRIADYAGTWTRLPFSFVIGDNAYVGSGAASGVMPDFWEYTSTNNTWTRKNDIPAGARRYGGLGFAIGDKGYGAIGVGIDGSSAKDDLWEYDTTADSWTQKANFGGGIRVNAVGFASATKGYIGTGHNNLGTYYNDFWEYNPITDTWAQKANYPGTGLLAGAGFSIGCHSYIGLGDTPYPGFVPQSDFWEFTPDNPTLNLTADTSICSGNPVTLTASGGVSYLWSPGTGLNTINGATVIATPTASTTYTVTDTSANGCGASGTVSITVTSGVSAGVSADTSICSGSTVTLVATGGSSYIWSPSTGLNDTTGATVSATPLSSTIYTVQITSGACSATANVAITVNPNDTASVTISPNSPGPYCANAPVTFTATPVNGGTPVYQWQLNGLNTGTNNPVFISGSLADSDVVSCIMASTANCVSGSPATSNQLIVIIIPGPVAGTISASMDSICAGNAIVLNDSGSSGNIQWQSSADGISFTNVAGASSTVYHTSGLTQTTYYRVSSSGTCGVDTSASFKVFVSPIPVSVLATNDSLICSGDSTQICELNPFASYHWSNGSPSSCIFVHDAGGYWLTVTNAFGCSAVSGHQNISTYPVPVVSITVHGDTLSSINALSSQWLLNDTLIPGATDSVYIARETGNYVVVVTDSNGCTTQSTVTRVVVSGIETLTENSQFEIYPNPATNTLMIRTSNFTPETISVSDAAGKLIMKEKFVSQLPINSLAPGVYFIEIQSAKTAVRRKFLKL